MKTQTINFTTKNQHVLFYNDGKKHVGVVWRKLLNSIVLKY